MKRGIRHPLGDAGFGRLRTLAQAVELAEERALSDALADILTTAQEHIAQYVAYSEAMREFGRGMSPDSAWTADNLTAQMAGILARHTAARKGDT